MRICNMVCMLLRHHVARQPGRRHAVLTATALICQKSAHSPAIPVSRHVFYPHRAVEICEAREVWRCRNGTMLLPGAFGLQHA